MSRSAPKRPRPSIDLGFGPAPKSTKAKPVRVPVEGDFLRLHRSSEQGYVLIQEAGGDRRRQVYVGPFYTPDKRNVSPDAIQAARRLLREAQAGVLRPEKATGRAVARAIRAGRSGGVRVEELTERYKQHVGRKYAQRQTQLPHYKTALKRLEEHAGDLSVEDFGPVDLTALRDAMASERDEGHPSRSRYVRRSVNETVARILRCFKWGVSVELVPVNIYTALQAVEPIEADEVKGLRESREVSAAPLDDVRAVLPFLSRQLAAVVMLQVFAAARPSEILGLRPMDIDRSGEGWTAVIAQHKNAWRGKKHKRVLDFSQEAQRVLEPFLHNRLPSAPLFSPAEAERERLAERHAERNVDPRFGNRPGYSERVRAGREPEKAPGETYTADSYRRAVERACAKAGVPRFTPYQLRHTGLTIMEAETDERHAGAAAGHKDGNVTKRYHESLQERKLARAGVVAVGRVAAKAFGLESA